MTMDECLRKKKLVAITGCRMAAALAVVVFIFVGYYTVYDGAISAINAVFHTKSAEQFVWGALRFWFGFAVSFMSGCLAGVGILRVFSPLERYYMRKIGEARRADS